MSNDSNRDARQISPSELQASDFFPPGHGWNKDDEGETTGDPRGPSVQAEDQDGADAFRPRPN